MSTPPPDITQMAPHLLTAITAYNAQMDALLVSRLAVVEKHIRYLMILNLITLILLLVVWLSK